jgi:CTD kinase subunit alpha
MNPTRIVVKNTGFKPIGQSSSALKKFFPGDEDDMDISSDLSGVADSEVPVPEPPSPHLPPRPPEQQPRPELLHASLPMRPTDDVGVVELPRRLPSPPPLGISRDSSVAMEESSQPDEAANGKPSQPSSPPLHTPKQADLDASDNADISMSSTRTRNELYAIVSQVGEGTFGKVYKAQNTVTKLHVALKRIRMESEKEGFPVTAMREIKLLQSLRHENVIQLYEMMVSNGAYYTIWVLAHYLNSSFQVQCTWSSSTWTMT